MADWLTIIPRSRDMTTLPAHPISPKQFSTQLGICILAVPACSGFKLSFRQPRWLPCLPRPPCLGVPCTLPLVIQMQVDITDAQAALAATAFAVPLLLQFFHVFYQPYALNSRKRPDVSQLYCCLFWLVCGTIFAVLFGLARAGVLPHAPEFFVAWDGVSLLSAETFQVFSGLHRPWLSLTRYSIPCWCIRYTANSSTARYPYASTLPVDSGFTFPILAQELRH